VISTLTVNPPTFVSTRPFGDIETGALGTLTGTCGGGIFLLGEDDLCGSNGQIPQPNHLLNGFSVFGESSIGQEDDFSGGSTIVKLPEVTFNTPFGGESVKTPYQTLAIVHYVDPLVQVNNGNARGVNPFPTPPVPSIASPDPVSFSFAPLGSTAFTILGNVNVPGGLPLPTTLTPGGIYVDRWTMTDPRGDSVSSESSFIYQGNTQIPNNLTVPICSATANNGIKASVAKAKPKKKKKTKSKTETVTLTCPSSLAGARVAVWVYRGKTLVVDGSGLVSGGKAKIALSAPSSSLKKGTYQLTEVIDFNGNTAEANHTLKLK
jgi:hypothetical protein